jgi:hypothetical protein
MKNRFFIIFMLIGVAYTLFTFLYSPSIEEPEVLYQADIETGVHQTAPYSDRKIQIDDYMITPLADIEITARVLSRENYWMDREADLSPVDLALGWGRMSDPVVLDQISISQSSRWYYWKTPKFPIPRKEIETHSANMHMIPANDYVHENLDQVRQGQHVRITGHLVRVDAKDGWFWKSSLTRNDTGNHACELVYVTELALFQ